MGRIKELFNNLDQPEWLLDAEYQEWMLYAEKPYYESKQDTTKQNKAQMGNPKDDLSLY